MAEQKPAHEVFQAVLEGGHEQNLQSLGVDRWQAKALAGFFLSEEHIPHGALAGVEKVLRAHAKDREQNDPEVLRSLLFASLNINVSKPPAHSVFSGVLRKEHSDKLRLIGLGLADDIVLTFTGYTLSLAFIPEEERESLARDLVKAAQGCAKADSLTALAMALIGIQQSAVLETTLAGKLEYPARTNLAAVQEKVTELTSKAEGGGEAEAGAEPKG